MEKLNGYIGVLLAILLSYVFFFPMDSSFDRKNSKISKLDELPASFIVKANDESYDIYSSAKEYELCVSIRSEASCEISFRDFSAAYTFLLKHSKKFYEFELQRHEKGIKIRDEEFYKKMAIATTSYSNEYIKRDLAFKFYAANVIVLVLILTILLCRRIVGRCIVFPFLAAKKIISILFRVIVHTHKKI